MTRYRSPITNLPITNSPITSHQSPTTALLLDIGSTYTKAAVIDLDTGDAVAQACALTTVEHDVSLGVVEAVENATGRRFNPKDFDVIRACSSAAGGLRIVAIGLTPSLTAQAARQAALGAGGKVVATYSKKLSLEDVGEILCIAPDVILLVGGTDEGDSSVILHNAKAIAGSEICCPVVVAGNRSARDQAVDCIRYGRSNVIGVDNVMPDPNRFHLAPARNAIRQLFSEHIVEAKGLHDIRAIVDGDVIPTPSSVLIAAHLLADGSCDQRGLGELLLVDVGGATTDVHSVATGEPTRLHVIPDLEDEPRVKRTVEGDLGMRVSCLTLLDAAGVSMVCEKSEWEGTFADLRERVEILSRDVGQLPDGDQLRKIDIGLGRCAVAIAIERHAGRLIREEGSSVIIQKGKDLSNVVHVIGTGGVFARNRDAARMLDEAIAKSRDSITLSPRAPKRWLDKSYLLWASGLMCDVDSKVAFDIASHSLVPI